MEEKYLNLLKSIKHKKQDRVGRNALNFGNKVQNFEILPQLLNQRFNRDSLLEVCNDKSNTNLVVTIAVLAWGGMRFDHAKNLFNNWEDFNYLINGLRHGKIKNRIEAFECFQNARIKGELSGMGIGYFTKLICFLNPSLNGFILDQWTGKSINLIWGDKLVDINSVGWVSDKNTPLIYDEFCNRIIALSKKLEINPLVAEELIFSVGGKNQGLWRKYLKKNYRDSLL